MITDRGFGTAELSGVLWRKSAYSGNTGACVEIADLDSGRAVRDSKDPGGLVLIFTLAGWSAFTSAVRSGEFD